MRRSALLPIAGRLWLTVAVAAIAGAATVALAQAPADGGHHQFPARPDRHQMMQMMAADDQRLAGLIVTMNMATGDEKVAAIAAVVNELVAQRARMQMQMRMQARLMDQMMSHMAAMHGPGGMMNKKAPEPVPGVSDQDHAAHHPEK
jgi:hypothetical protein